MKSKTSFCNGAVVRRTVFKGLPLWGAYLLCWLIALPIVVLSADSTNLAVSVQRYTANAAAYSSAIVPFLYGPAAAFLAFGYLYKSVSANFFGSLPLRRETMFGSVYLAGFLFALVPNVLITVLTLAAGALRGVALLPHVLWWLAGQTLGFLFYYNFAVLVAVIVGNLPAMPILYLILNFTAVVVEAIVRDLLDAFLFGACLSYDLRFTWASPLVYCLFEGNGLRAVEQWDGEKLLGSTVVDWTPMLIYAGVGILIAVAAFLIHRQRRLEAAGDVIAVRHLRPVALYGFTAGCSLVLGYVLSSICTEGTLERNFPIVLVCMLIGALIGFFVGQMLLNRTVRVFSGKNFRRCGICAAVIIALMLCARMDIFGYCSYIPPEDEIVSVSLDNRQYYDGPAFIAGTRALHAKILAERGDIENYGPNCHICYRMKDGSIVERSYDMEYDESENSIMTKYWALWNDPEYTVRRTLPADYTAKDIVAGTINSYTGTEISLNREEAYTFLKTCVEPDLRETKLAKDTHFTADSEKLYTDYEIYIEFKNPTDEYGSRYVWIQVTKDAQRILDYIAEMEH